MNGTWMNLKLVYWNVVEIKNLLFTYRNLCKLTWGQFKPNRKSHIEKNVELSHTRKSIDLTIAVNSSLDEQQFIIISLQGAISICKIKLKW
jgi:hypothetical protein